jgi:hypothetical protein
MTSSIRITIARAASLCAALLLLGPFSSTRAALAQADDAAPDPGAGELGSSPGEVRSDEVVTECLAKHTGGQELRRERRLLESRQAFRECSAPRCPQQVIRDCLGWLEQYERQIPSLSIRVTARGEDRWDAVVSIDDQPVPDRRTGRAIELDPGAHRIRVELPPLAPFQKEIVINEGEQFRVVDVVLDSPRPPTVTREIEVAHEPPMHRPIPVASYVFAGVGVAAVASGTAWALSMRALHRELERECAAVCARREVDVLKQRALFADVSWAVGAASMTSAVIIYLLRPEEPVAPDAVQVQLSWMPWGEARGTLTLRGF